jgi:hypothetical protein
LPRHRPQRAREVQGFADKSSGHLIPTQGTLTDNSLWGNELHPTGKRFAQIADKFRAALNSHFAHTA